MNKETLGNILEQAGKERAGKRNFPILSITMRDGLVDQSQKFKKRVASANTSTYKVVYSNELVVGFPIDEGVLGFQQLYSAGIVSPAYDIWKLKKPQEIHIPFLEQYLRSPQARAIYASKMQGGVARRRSIKKDVFLDIEIPLPSFDEQKRITAILDKANALRRLRKQSLDLTEKLIQSVFLEIFGDPVRNSMKWPLRRLGEFGIVQTGNTPPRKDPDNYAREGIEWIKTNNIPEEGILVEPALEMLSPKGYELARVAPSDSILITCIAGSERSIGRAALTDREVAFNQQINAITPHKDTSSLFLYYMLKIGRRHIQNAAGVGMKKLINKSTFENLKFIDPPYDNLQLEFEKKARIISEQLKLRATQSPLVDNLFSSLQQQAFRGELDLSNLMLDEEAEGIIDAVEKYHTLIHETLPRSLGDGVSIQSLKPSKAKETQLVKQDKAIEKDGQIPWSADYFKFRILAKQTSHISIADLMAKAGDIFTEPNYDKIRDILFDYLDSSKGKPVLTQTFDDKRKEVVLQPA